MKSFFSKPASVFLFGLLVSVMMLAIVYWFVGSNEKTGWSIYPSDSDSSENIEVLTFDPKVFVAKVGPWICVYWIAFTCMYWLLQRTTLEVKNEYALVHGFCATVGFAIYLFMNSISPRLMSDVYFGGGLTVEAFLEMHERLMILNTFLSDWTKIASIFILLGFMFASIGIRKKKTAV